MDSPIGSAVVALPANNGNDHASSIDSSVGEAVRLSSGNDGSWHSATLSASIDSSVGSEAMSSSLDNGSEAPSAKSAGGTEEPFDHPLCLLHGIGSAGS
jgi:hypothetical protein